MRGRIDHAAAARRRARGGGHADAEGRVYAPYRRDRTRLLESLALAIGLPSDALEWEP